MLIKVIRIHLPDVVVGIELIWLGFKACGNEISRIVCHLYVYHDELYYSSF